MLSRNLAVQYDEIMRSYESSLTTDYKKINGIFYTDLFLADLIVKDLKIKKKSVIIDPCCGTGSFLIASVQNGATLVYGADKDKGVCDKSSLYLKNSNIIEADTIGSTADETIKKLKLKKKADYIIGNPPFAPLKTSTLIKTKDYNFVNKVAKCGNNLFIAALIRALEMVKIGGVVSYIIPKNFLHVNTYSLLRKEILKENTIISIIDIGAHFKNVRGEQIVLTIKKETPQNNQILIKKLANGVFAQMMAVDQNYYADEILLFGSSEELSVYKKMKSSYQILNDQCKGYVGRGKSKGENAVSGKDIRKFGYKNMQTPVNGNKILIQNIYSTESGIIAAFGGNLEAGETVTVFTDGEEKMCRYILGILHSRLCNFFLYKFCYNSSSLTMHADAKYLKKIPLPFKNDIKFEKIVDTVMLLEKTEYMIDEWYDLIEILNGQVYDAYGVNQKEVSFINQAMQKVQSKRWLKNGKRQKMQ